MPRMLCEPGGEAPNCCVFVKDSGKCMRECLCVSVYVHVHTHTIMLGALGVPQNNDSTLLG